MNKKQIQAKGCFRKNLLLSLGMLMFLGVSGIVQAAQQPSRFQEVEGSNGSIVRDTTTGLEWQRCPYGQSWTDSGCSGRAWQESWHNAWDLTAPGGFRVPTIDELKTLVHYDQNVFPGPYWFWSSSDLASSPGYAWYLSFGYGGRSGAGSLSKRDKCQVRLVRAGQ